MGLISFGRQQERDMRGQKGDCGCGGLGPDCIEKTARPSTTMGGPFTEGMGTGAGVAVGLVAAGWLLSLVLGRKEA